MCHEHSRMEQCNTRLCRQTVCQHDCAAAEFLMWHSLTMVFLYHQPHCRYHTNASRLRGWKLRQALMTFSIKQKICIPIIWQAMYIVTPLPALHVNSAASTSWHDNVALPYVTVVAVDYQRFSKLKTVASNFHYFLKLTEASLFLDKHPPKVVLK